MKKILISMMLFITSFMFAQTYNKVTFVGYAKAGDSYTPIDGFFKVVLPDDVSSVIKLHFCTTEFHYDLGILEKNVKMENTSELEKSTIRTFMLKDYNKTNTEVFDMNLIEWYYPNKNKLYYSLVVDGITYHFQVSKKEFYEDGILVNTLTYLTN